MGDREFLEADDVESVQLSQESQLSAVSTNLSQDLSQGSADLDTALASSKNRTVDKKKKKKSKRDKRCSSQDNEKVCDGNEAGDCDNSGSIKSSKRSSKSSKVKSEKSDTSEKKHRKHSSRRPDPEGGNPAQPDTNGIIEYERIINSTDPLFSDLELDLTDDAKQEANRPRRPPRQSRAGLSGGIFIPCTQLGINSNTMIKFAIIGTELQNIFQVSQRLESDTAGLNRRIQLLEEDLERSEERLQSATEKLEEASKAADESERQRRTVENKLNAGDERLEEAETLLRQARQVASESEARYDEAARKLVVLENELEKAEERAENAERKVKALEAEVHALTNNLRSLERCEEKASQREDSYEETIRDLTQRLKDAECRAEFAEREVISLQKSKERMEDELEQSREQNAALRMEMDQCINDLENL